MTTSTTTAPPRTRASRATFLRAVIVTLAIVALAVAFAVGRHLTASAPHAPTPAPVHVHAPTNGGVTSFGRCLPGYRHGLCSGSA